MSTDLSLAGRTSPMSLGGPAAEPRVSRPRLVIVERDTEMVALLRDIAADDYEIAVPGPASIAAIDAEEPDVVIVGTLESGGLTRDEIVALAAAHMGLHDVPIIVLSADANVLADAGRLTQFPLVTVVSLPFDLDTIRFVLDSVTRRASTGGPSAHPITPAAPSLTTVADAPSA